MNQKTNFNKFIDENYYKLKKYCENYGLAEDLIHDAYLNIIQKIEKTGFEGDTYLTYVIRSMVNTDLNNKKHSNNKKVVYIEDENNGISEDKLNEIISDLDTDEEEYQTHLRNQYIVSKLFKYLQYEMKMTDYEIMIFKIYFLSKQKMTYKKLYMLCGINKNKVTRIIRKIKKELNTNFIEYLNDEQRRNEDDNEPAQDY